MLGGLRSVLHPERYHGQGRQPPFFEGWYYKLVDATQTQRLAIIPGIFLSRDPERHHAFVQVLNGTTGASAYHVYPAGQFRTERGNFRIEVGPNVFDARHVRLDLDSTEGRVTGEVRFPETAPWPVTMRSPGIMGWYAWMPAMECYHGVLSLDHGLEGELNVDGTVINFSGGRGYIEKDWGKSFPAAWVWMQTNHFATPGASLTASIAIIPWLRTAFPGFIIGFWREGTLLRFATYTGAKTRSLTIDDEIVHWVVEDGRYSLEMRAVRAEGGLLYGPTREEMHRRVAETLNAEVEVTLRTREGEVLFEETGRHAGLEVHGELERLLALG